MHVAVALNLWGDVVVLIFFGFFFKSHHQRTPKLIPVSNLGFPKYTLSILILRLSLIKCLLTNLIKKAKTVSLPLKLLKLIFSNMCMPVITPKRLWDLHNLMLSISHLYRHSKV